MHFYKGKGQAYSDQSNAHIHQVSVGEDSLCKGCSCHCHKVGRDVESQAVDYVLGEDIDKADDDTHEDKVDSTGRRLWKVQTDPGQGGDDDRSGFFEPVSLNEDDLRRNAMYMQNAKRTAERAAFSDYGEYLKSLEMEAVIDDFLPVYLARITQLTNKSNQFNLTTRRYTAAEMEKTWKDPASVCLYGKPI